MGACGPLGVNSACQLLAHVLNARVCVCILRCTVRMGSTTRKLRVYTRTGDKGTSSLFNGTRSEKSNAVFHALGDTDEVNASIGLAAEHCRALAATDEHVGTLLQRLAIVQSRLLDAGSAIATPTDTSSEEQLRRTRFPDGVVSDLEAWIDEMDDELPPLRNFILPVRWFCITACTASLRRGWGVGCGGREFRVAQRQSVVCACALHGVQSGSLASAQLHVARTVCRRAERSVVAIGAGVPSDVLQFLNRFVDCAWSHPLDSELLRLTL
jgi:cob(I)alamin adenosyltransferase